MLKYHYTNPMTKTYQYEYAMYLKTAELFAGACCDSPRLASLKLYYAELVRESKTTQQPNYEQQFRMEDEIQALLEKDVLGKIHFPGMDVCQAAVLITREEDGTHTFLFTDGVYGFTLHLQMSPKGWPAGIRIANLGRQPQKNAA